MRQPRIGLLTMKSPYRDIEEGIRKKVLKALTDADLKVVVDDVISNKSEVKCVVKKLREKDADIIIVNFHGWQTGDIMIHLAKMLQEIPIVIWGLGKTKEPLISSSPYLELSAFLEATSNLKRIGKGFKLVIGGPDGDALQQIRTIAKAATLVKELYDIKLGMIGYPPPGMVDATPYELGCIAKFGLGIEHLDLLELAREKKKISDDEVKKTVETLRKNFIIKAEEESVTEASKLYLALRKVIDTHDLDAVTLRCSPELRYECLPCLALSMLSSESVTTACEADLSSALTALILEELTNSPSCTFDFGEMDKAANTITLWHCGFCWDTKLVEATSEKFVLSQSPFGKGLFLSLLLKPGKITLAKLDKECNKMLVAEGEVIRPKKIQEGGFAEVQLEENVNDFLMKAAINGFEHHIVLIYGRLKDELKELCNMLGIDAIS